MTDQIVTLERKADFATIHAFAVMSGDFNPIHVDPEFAAKTELGTIVAHGHMSTGLLWEALTATFGPEAVGRITVDGRFRKPVRENDVIRTRGTASADDANRYDFEVVNQNDDVIMNGQVLLREA